MMEKSRLAEIVEKNPKIDRTEIERGEQAIKQLADVGIKVGGYRPDPTSLRVARVPYPLRDDASSP